MDHWPRWFALAKVDVPAQLPGPVFDHQFLCMQAAMNDLGIALALWSLLEDDIRADRLRPLFAQPQLPNAGIHALYRHDGPAAASAPTRTPMLYSTPSAGLQWRGITPPLALSDYRVIAFDMDSTLISIETLDEMADLMGKKAEVAALPEAAMRGEIVDYKQSLRDRVALLAGMPEAPPA
ncbi:hypothetical protein G6F50_014227 [Rhizopus delemar]|uniref:phosphoserine phosphatase n=1 Tax=Rhizopus delemar TaxID=936053 RepID=A0A9P7C900_9FUNG|nr:hypothetical protein G6F50_014227 [Rhizopus delemar]